MLENPQNILVLLLLLHFILFVVVLPISLGARRERGSKGQHETSSQTIKTWVKAKANTITDGLPSSLPTSNPSPHNYIAAP